MNTPTQPQTSTLRIVLLGALLALTGAPALAELANGSAAEIQARYERERADCLSGRTTNLDRATCLREAAAARDEARRQRLDSGNANYQRNATQRCAARRGEEQRDCMRRMRGAGTVSGSVGGGGVLRELHTIEVGPVIEVPVAPPEPPPQRLPPPPPPQLPPPPPTQ